MAEVKRFEKECGTKIEWDKLTKEVQRDKLLVETIEVKYHDRFAPEIKEENAAAPPKYKSLFRTVYENKTNNEQRYTISTERSTTQSLSMYFSRSMFAI